MAVKLRLMRMGKKKQPTYRVVAADSRSPRDGRFIEIIGTYEPRQEPSVIKIDNDRALHWLRHGAHPTDRVEKLLKISGAWELHTGQPVDQPVAAAVSAKSATSPSTAEATAEAEDSDAGSSKADGGD
ncbi:MAG: 30S ribosomal protein S16 [Acidimicrobiaceae bacterium]|nr:30S ribosomal protein S16 [Acidimicrobiaceae bacterium]MYD08070.1 30S ribosomal protein S16 [Acidimicrobiaceae bacterium]MYI57383.1 30S ribosomal protein S16 [Acidimicrobiaceae bacterium]